MATQSISTLAPSGNPATSTVDLAGKFVSPKNSLNASFKSEKSFRSFRYTVSFTILTKERFLAFNIAAILCNA